MTESTEALEKLAGTIDKLEKVWYLKGIFLKKHVVYQFLEDDSAKNTQSSKLNQISMAKLAYNFPF